MLIGKKSANKTLAYGIQVYDTLFTMIWVMANIKIQIKVM